MSEQSYREFIPADRVTVIIRRVAGVRDGSLTQTEHFEKTSSCEGDMESNVGLLIAFCLESFFDGGAGASRAIAHAITEHECDQEVAGIEAFDEAAKRFLDKSSPPNKEETAVTR